MPATAGPNHKRRCPNLRRKSKSVNGGDDVEVATTAGLAFSRKMVMVKSIIPLNGRHGKPRIGCGCPSKFCVCNHSRPALTTKTQRHEVYEVGQARKPARRAYLISHNTAFSATDYTDFHRFSSILADFSVKICDHPWQKQKTPVSSWLFFVPSCLRGPFERIAAQNQKYDGHPSVALNRSDDLFFPFFATSHKAWYTTMNE